MSDEARNYMKLVCEVIERAEEVNKKSISSLKDENRIGIANKENVEGEKEEKEGGHKKERGHSIPGLWTGKQCVRRFISSYGRFIESGMLKEGDIRRMEKMENCLNRILLWEKMERLTPSQALKTFFADDEKGVLECLE